MSFRKTDDVSISLTSIFMKLVGLWIAANKSEQRVRNITVGYTMIAIIFGTWIQITDMCYSWGDFSTCIYITCNLLSLSMAFLKILVLLAHKEDFFRLILYLQERFLYADYNDYEKRIIIGCKRKCIFFVSFLTFSIMATLGAYVLKPIIANISRNTSDRILPFNMWVDLPLTVTPYYEITFVLQVLSLYHIGITYFCFDNFLCILNLHVAAQFRILQYRISNITDLMNRETLEINQRFSASSSCFANKYYETFKKCIRQHQALIAYCKKLEEVFNLIVLVQILVFSMMICLHGYQILIAKTSNIVRTIFICHISGCLCQLLMFTYSCDCIIRESLNIAIAVYRGPWPFLPSTTSGKMMRKDLTIVIMRSSVPCYLTGRGFFIVSLETYTSVLSTAASYFTLLKQRVEATS
ncbi:hypothetical protein QLX08_009946 [Tetragonisca angustula]|uniref:Odorant receptor n=1 Tax=Tetragonisca angustula TaxID=166442 RepID=A0AAW0ZDX5_9HYME